MRRADRLIKIIHFLRSRRQAVTAKQIGEEFEICQRTVYRDIANLMDSGVPIRGEAGIGYVIDKQYFLPPIVFDIDELEAINLGISMVRQWTDDKFAAKASHALAKVQAVLPTKLLHEFEQITTYTMPSHPPVPWSVNFSDVRDCIRQSRKLEIDYQDKDQQISARTIRPLALFFFSPVWIVAAWCELRNDFRHFRLDRIEKMVVSEQKFAHESDKTLQAHMRLENACFSQLN